MFWTMHDFRKWNNCTLKVEWADTPYSQPTILFWLDQPPQQVIGIISSVMKSSNWILMGNHNRLQNTSGSNEFPRSLAFHITHWPILLLFFPRPDETQNIYKTEDKLMIMHFNTTKKMKETTSTFSGNSGLQVWKSGCVKFHTDY